MGKRRRGVGLPLTMEDVNQPDYKMRLPFDPEEKGYFMKRVDRGEVYREYVDDDYPGCKQDTVRSGISVNEMRAAQELAEGKIRCLGGWIYKKKGTF